MRGLGKERHAQMHTAGAFSNECRGKVKYTTIKSAEGALRVMRETHPRSKLKRYRCGNCRQWHIGNSR